MVTINLDTGIEKSDIYDHTCISFAMVGKNPSIKVSSRACHTIRQTLVDYKAENGKGASQYQAYIL